MDDKDAGSVSARMQEAGMKWDKSEELFARA